MKNKYTFQEIINGDLIRLFCLEYGAQLFTKGKAAKVHFCIECNKPIQKSTFIFRPITNCSNRMDRICVDCIAELTKTYFNQ